MRYLQFIVKKPCYVYFFMALLILLPLMKPGYIFALDMVFTPDIRLPSEITASYPLYLAMWLLDKVFPSWLVQKLLLFGIFFLAGKGAHMLAKLVIENVREITKGKAKEPFYLSFVPFYAGILYMVNPFTYERLMDGHWAVLFGYALLPFFVKALFQLLFSKEHHNIRKTGEVALWAVLVSIVSIHAIGYLIVLSLVAAGVLLWQNRKNMRDVLPQFKWLAVSAGIVLVASSFWLVPTLRGNTSRTELIAEFDYRHLLSFRTDGKTDVGAMGNVAGLYGYWGEREDRFIVTRFVLVYWPILAAVIIGLAVYGWWKNRHNPMVNILAIAAVVAFILALGVTVKPFSIFNRVLYEHVPFFRGFREPQKFVTVLALAYSVLGSLGIAALLQEKRFRKWPKANKQAALAILLMLPVMYTPVIFWGGLNQLKASEYPQDWYQMSERLSRESGRVLFLPWHQYMYFDFAGRNIANPAPRFFDGHIIAGDNAEIGLIERQVHNPESEKIEQLLADAQNGKNITAELISMDIEYVLLSKNADWQEYDYLNKQPGLQLESESDTLRLYKVKTNSTISKSYVTT